MHMSFETPRRSEMASFGLFRVVEEPLRVAAGLVRLVREGVVPHDLDELLAVRVDVRERPAHGFVVGPDLGGGVRREEARADRLEGRRRARGQGQREEDLARHASACVGEAL
jgi:hypothetical protein